MPTKVQLRRMRAKQKRNKRLKEQAQQQSEAPELLQTGKMIKTIFLP